jgi:hypothetical protein
MCYTCYARLTRYIYQALLSNNHQLVSALTALEALKAIYLYFHKYFKKICFCPQK